MACPFAVCDSQRRTPNWRAQVPAPRSVHRHDPACREATLATWRFGRPPPPPPPPRPTRRCTVAALLDVALIGLVASGITQLLVRSTLHVPVLCFACVLCLAKDVLSGLPKPRLVTEQQDLSLGVSQAVA